MIYQMVRNEEDAWDLAQDGFVRDGDEKPDRYRAQIVSVTAGDDSLDATVIDADGVKVVWITGLEQLPSDYVLE